MTKLYVVCSSGTRGVISELNIHHSTPSGWVCDGYGFIGARVPSIVDGRLVFWLDDKYTTTSLNVAVGWAEQIMKRRSESFHKDMATLAKYQEKSALEERNQWY